MPASAEAHRPATVVVIAPSGSRSRLPLQKLPFSIGRSPDNQLVLRDNRASRNHARILADAGEYFVEDLKSSHGVYVNGTQVTRHKLHNSDRIEFGVPDSYSLVFTYDDGEMQKILDKFSATGSASGGAGGLAKLGALVEIARALQNSLSTDDVLAAVVDAALTITQFERGFLLLENCDDLEIRVARNRQSGSIPKADLRESMANIRLALRNRRELLAMTFIPAEGAEAGIVVCVPLVRIRSGMSSEETCLLTSKSDTVGLVYLDTTQTAPDLSSGSRELLQTLALEASTILENARLLEEERVKQRMEEELNIARDIQASLLPRSLPSDGWFRAAGSSLPSHQVGGDCFDVRQLDAETWTAIVSDVAGKGVSSALLATLLQGAFLLGSEASIEIEQMMSKINHFINERTEGEKYATVFYSTLAKSGRLRWVNAGHCAPFLIRLKGEMEMLNATGMPLGLMDQAVYAVEEAQLEPGDKIFVFSDGLSEAANREGKMFDLARLKSTLREHAAAGCSELHDAVMREVEAFTGGAVQNDDITAVVIEYRP